MYWVSGSAAALTKYVQPGPLVQGNFKDPNGWSYTIRDTRWWKGNSFTRYTNTGVLFDKDGYIGGSEPTELSWTDYRNSTYNACLEKFNSKVRGELDLSIALAEAGTTTRMVRGITKVVNLAKMRGVGGLDDLANGWLQWQYGWKPLVSDVFRAADEAIRVVTHEIEKIRARVTIPIWIQDKYIMSSKSIDGLYEPVMYRLIKGKASCTIAGRLNVSQFDLARWTSLNPVSIGWELIPYSFVVDWFIDVGSWLRNIETELRYGSAWNGGYVSELFAYDSIETSDSSKTWVSVGAGTTRWLKVTGGKRYRQFQRQPLPSYPLARAPTFKVDLGSQRMISAAALLYQIFSGAVTKVR